jgi:hypothetical protein
MAFKNSKTIYKLVQNINLPICERVLSLFFLSAELSCTYRNMAVFSNPGGFCSQQGSNAEE